MLKWINPLYYLHKYRNNKYSYHISNIDIIEMTDSLLNEDQIYDSNDKYIWQKSIDSNRLFKDIILPGSHDSSMNSCNFKTKVNKGLFKIIEKIANHSKYVNNFVKNWTITQSHNITQQLENGIRYFDLRISYDLSNKIFYISHTYVDAEFKTKFQEMVDFLIKYPSEYIVISIKYDFHNKNDINYDREIKFINELLDKYQKYIYFRNISMNFITVEDIRGKILIIYQKNNNVNISKYMFDYNQYLNEIWPNSSNIKTVLEYLDNNIYQINKLNCVQYVLTPSTKNIVSSFVKNMVSKKKTNLEYYHHIAEQNMDSLFDIVKGKKQFVNFIITDFVDMDWSRRIVELNN